MNSHRPLIIAHRGASAEAPENTLASFRRAIECSVDFVEFDVRCTADGHFVAIHDDTVNRTTNGQGAVAAMTLSELKQLDAGSWFDSCFAGERIPTLDEALDCCLPFVPVCFDFYSAGSEVELVEHLAFRLRNQLANTVLVYPYTMESFQTFKHITLPCWLAAFQGIYEFSPLPSADEVGSDLFSLRHTKITKENLERAHRQGFEVWAWTVDDLADVQRLVEWGIDGITTNDPGRLLVALYKKI
jgi:glycerophosphoryl diester phosphodiesterase